MYGRIRQTGNYECHRRSTWKAFAGICQVVTLLSLVSCASPKPTKVTDWSDPTQNAIDAFERVCLSGEGKGKISIGPEANSFSYESRLNIDESNWVLGISIPFLGEEILKIDYAGINHDKLSVSGGLIKMIMSEIKKSGHDVKGQQRAVKRYLNLTAKFMAMQTNIRRDGMEQYCRVTNFSANSVTGICKFPKFREALMYKVVENQFQIKTKQGFSASFSDLEDGYYRLMTLTSNKTNLGLKLQASECIQ